MQIVESQLADIREARAYQVGDVLIVRVEGKRPTACHIVTLEWALTDVEPPTFVARLTIDPRARCAWVEADFEVAQAFRVGPLREEVVLHHAGGELRLEVRPLSAEGDGDSSSPDEMDSTQRVRPRPALPQPEPSEAVGYSRDYDLGEAIKDAISRLPDQAPGFNDWLSHYTVVSIGAEIGGIAGFNRLKVTVRG